MSISRDGKHVASAGGDRTVRGGDNTVRVWDAINGQEPVTLTCNGTCAWGFAFSPDGKFLAFQGLNNAVKLRDLTTGQELVTIQGAGGSLSYSPDGKRLAGTGVPSGEMKVWDALTGREVFAVKGYTRAAFSPDGKRLAAPSADNMVKIWDAATGRELLTLKNRAQGVEYVVFSPDSKLLASGHGGFDPGKRRDIDCVVKLWDAETGQEVLTLSGHSEKVHGLCFSPDGKRLASTSHDQTVMVWDTSTGQALFTLRGHTSVTSDVAFSPDGKRLASASWDTTVMLWDTTTGLEVLTLRGHRGGVEGVAFSPDGKRLASISGDGLKVWDADSGEWPLPEGRR